MPGRAGKEEDLSKRFNNRFRVLDQADFGMPADLGTALKKLPRHELSPPCAPSARSSRAGRGAADEGSPANVAALLFDRWSRSCDMPSGESA
jgi:hypothetical protein